MLMADTMNIFLPVLGLLITFPSLWLLLRAVWPNMVDEAAARVSGGMWKSFFAGLPILVGTVIGATALGKIDGGGGGAAGIALVCFAIIYACTGVSGIVTVLGARLPSPVDADRPWKRTLRGGIVLVLSWLMPFVGWFVILPFTVVAGAGTVTRVFCTRLAARLRGRGKVKAGSGAASDSGSGSVGSTITTSSQQSLASGQTASSGQIVSSPEMAPAPSIVPPVPPASALNVAGRTPGSAAPGAAESIEA